MRGPSRPLTLTTRGRLLAGCVAGALLLLALTMNPWPGAS